MIKATWFNASMSGVIITISNSVIFTYALVELKLQTYLKNLVSYEIFNFPEIFLLLMTKLKRVD